MSEMTPKFWYDKRYHSLDYELKEQFHHKLYKLSIDGGMSCPNRDGTISRGGCIFCSEGGSGDFATDASYSITNQLERAKEKIASKHTKDDPHYIAYFQAYTNTYAPVSYLKNIFYEAISHPQIEILSIATRPDCIPFDVLDLLSELNQIKPVWIELGLQTIHQKTADFINRGYSLSTFDDAVKRLHERGIAVIVHTIFGLPYETKNEMLETIQYVANLPIQGMKLQLLHILKNTKLGDLYEQGVFTNTMSYDDYLDLLIESIEQIPEQIVLHRLTGDGPRSLLLAPLWSTNKRMVLNGIQSEMKRRNTWQGKYFSK